MMRSCLAVIGIFALVVSTNGEGLQCYKCGYQRKDGGDMTPMEGEPFCKDFASPDNLLVTCQPGDCCAAKKELELTTEDGGQTWHKVLTGKHDCGNDIDSKFDYECKDAQKTGVACKDFDVDHLPEGHSDNEIKATMCYCDTDGCNKEDPMIDSPDDNGATAGAGAAGLLMVLAAAAAALRAP